MKRVVVSTLLFCFALACGLRSKSEAPSVELGNSLKVIGDRKFALTEIASLPSHDKPGSITLQFLNTIGWLSNWNRLWMTIDGGRTWNLVDDSSSKVEASYTSPQFLNTEVGWRSTISTIERTSNAGRTWDRIKAPFEASDGVITSVRFLPEGTKGWLTGGIYRKLSPSEYGQFPPNAMNGDGTSALQGVIFYTEDSGQTWRRQEINTGLGTTVRELRVSPSGHVWAMAQYDLFFLEKDGWKKVDYRRCSGQNKRLLETTVNGDEQGDRYFPIDMDFIDELHGWLTFSNGLIAKTVDGGKTWCDLSTLMALNTKADQRLRVYFVDSSNGVALGGDRQLYETTDGGKEGTKIGLDEPVDDVFYNGKNMWAASKEKLFEVTWK